MLENPRKFKNSPNLLVLFVKITKFLEFSKKITIKTIVFSNSDRRVGTVDSQRERNSGRGAQAQQAAGDEHATSGADHT